MSLFGERPKGQNTPPEEPGTRQKTQAGQKIDLQALADKVYRLLKQELMLERERRGWQRR